MAELKEALKIGPDEGPEEYAERAEAVLEKHYEETASRGWRNPSRSASSNRNV